MAPKFNLPEEDQSVDEETSLLNKDETTTTKPIWRERLEGAWDWVSHPNGEPFLPSLIGSIKPGLTVSLVNIPLSIALALASGADPNAGIITAFWPGLIAAFFGGTRYNIVGPTGALSAVLLRQASEAGKDVLPLLSMLSAGMLFIVWICRFDRYIMFIPSSVIHGFTLGVAVIIGLGQLNNAVSLHNLPAHENFLARVFESLKNLGSGSPYAAGWFLANFIILMFLSSKFSKVPWAIVISVIGIVVGYLCEQGKLGSFHLATLGADYGDLTLNIIQVPHITQGMFTTDVFTSALTITFIALLETLISARIADGMTKTTHDQRREVLGLALGNLVGGSLGAIPATAALARTAFNIKSGARTRLAGVANCLFVLLLAVFVMPYFKYMPMSTVAALLSMVAVRMVSVEHLVHMYRCDRIMLGVAILSAFFCCAVDTMAGILVGAVISLLIFVDKMSEGQGEVRLHRGKKTLSNLNLAGLDSQTPNTLYRNQLSASCNAIATTLHPNSITNLIAGGVASDANLPTEEEFGDVLVYRLTGQLTYVNGLSHEHRLAQAVIDDHIMYVILSMRHLHYVDLDGLDTLAQVVEKLEASNVKVLVAGVPSGIIHNQLSKFSWFTDKIKSGKVFPSYLVALDALYSVEEHPDETIERSDSLISAGACAAAAAAASTAVNVMQLADERRRSIQQLRQSFGSSFGHWSTEDNKSNFDDVVGC